MMPLMLHPPIGDRLGRAARVMIKHCVTNATSIQLSVVPHMQKMHRHKTQHNSLNSSMPGLSHPQQELEVVPADPELNTLDCNEAFIGVCSPKDVPFSRVHPADSIYRAEPVLLRPIVDCVWDPLWLDDLRAVLPPVINRASLNKKICVEPH